MRPLIEKIARGMVAGRDGDPDELIVVAGRSYPRWRLEVEWAERSAIAHRMLADADGEPKPQPDGADRLTAANGRLAELLEKHPELSAYKYPASAGDMDAIGKKLDGIAASLKEISGLLARFAQNGGGR